MFESKISSKGQTTLPKPVREALGVKPGDYVRYAIVDDRVMLTSCKPITRLFGALKHDGAPKSLEDIDEAIAEAAVESALGR